MKGGKSGRALNSVLPTNGMQNFIAENSVLYEYAKNLNYTLFSKIYLDKDELLDDKKKR